MQSEINMYSGISRLTSNFILWMFVAMHQTFQHDLFRLRLNTARACVNALQSCSNPVSANINEPLKMSAQVFITSSLAQLVKKFRVLLNLKNH
jgi:hypothetical protein